MNHIDFDVRMIVDRIVVDRTAVGRIVVVQLHMHHNLLLLGMVLLLELAHLFDRMGSGDRLRICSSIVSALVITTPARKVAWSQVGGTNP